MIKFLDALFSVFAFLANVCKVSITIKMLVEWIRSKTKKK